MDAAPSTPAPAAGSRHLSRRTVLATGGAAVLVGGAAGTAVGVLRHLPADSAPPAPAALVSALAAEEELLAAARSVLSATAGATPAARSALATIAQDHLAHQTALQAALAGYRPSGSSSATVVPGSPVPPSPSATRPAGPVTSPAGLSAAEQRAASAGAARAAELSGRDATLLASIAACEATHAIWLSAVAP